MCIRDRYSAAERWRRSATSTSPATADSGVRISWATAAAKTSRSPMSVRVTLLTPAAAQCQRVAQSAHGANQRSSGAQPLAEIADVHVDHVRAAVVVGVPDVAGEGIA